MTQTDWLVRDALIRHCLAALEGRGVFIRTSGMAHVIGVLDGGTFLALLCPGAKPLTEVQKEWMNRVRRSGGIAACIRQASQLDRELEALEQ